MSSSSVHEYKINFDEIFDADVDLAESDSGVDVIVGGHTNTLMSNIYAIALEIPAGEPVVAAQAAPTAKI